MQHIIFRWLRLRSLELRTSDELPPLPIHLSWVRGGIFVIGMDNEMQIYSQWMDTFSGHQHIDSIGNNIVSDQGIIFLKHELILFLNTF